MVKTLIIGASGRIGSKIVKEFDENSEGVEIVLGTLFPKEAEAWEKEGKKAVVLDLNKPSDFPVALEGVERLFLLTTYTSDMLFQAKTLVDAAKEAGVKYIVHLGVFTSRRDPVPHFVWHDLIESYIEASGIAWTNIHPNVIIESALFTDLPITETNTISSYVGDAPQGWASTDDIAAIAATVLREGPEKHAGQDYYISTDVLTAKEIAKILSDVSGREFKINYVDLNQQKAYHSQIDSIPIRAYMESALITMELTQNGKFSPQKQIRDDVLKVVGRKGKTMKDLAEEYFNLNKDTHIARNA